MTIDVDALLDKAFECFNQKKMDEAESLTRQAQSVIPTHGDALYLLGLIALNKKIPTQACDYLTMAVKLYPKQSAYQIALADAYIELKNFKGAEKIYDSLPNSDEIELKRAWLEQLKGNSQKAKKLFEALLNTPKKSDALYALSFFKKGKEKLSDLLVSFELTPCEKTAQEIVEFLIDKKEYQKISTYIPWITDEFLLAKIDVLLEKKEDAQKRLDLLLKKYPYHVAAWILKAQLQEEQQQFIEAEFSYNQGLSLDKKNYQAHKFLARLLMKQSRFSEALDHYQIICRMNPEDKEILTAMALLAERTGEYSESLGLYFRLITLGAKNLTNAIKRNILLLSKTDKKLAKDFLKGWKKLCPKNKTIQKIKFIFLGICLLFPLNGWADLSTDEKNWQILWEGKMAEAGDAESQFYVGQLFEQGKEVQKDLIKAVQYYEKAAYQGYVPAAIKLGDIFSKPDNKPLYHPEKSVQWYQFAADKGDIQAQYYLASYYQEKDSIDLDKAKQYLEKALTQTFPKETDFSKVSPSYAALLEKIKKIPATERNIK